MNNRKHRGAENIENLCPVSRKRSAIKNGSVSVNSSATKTSALHENASSPSALTLEALEEMGIGMLDSEESSSSALSAIALAMSASSTSDENSNSNETTPHMNAPRMTHQQPQRMSLNSTADTTLEGVTSANSTLVEVLHEDAQQKLLRQSSEKLQALAQIKRAALSGESHSNSNSPNKRTRNPLATVTCNNQDESIQTLPPPQSPLNLQPSTSRQAQRQVKKSSPPPLIPLTAHPMPSEHFFVYRTPNMSAHLNSGINYFDKLSDEILLDIFKWLPKKTLLRLATVCRRFNCCIRDDTLWTRMDLGSKKLRPGALEQILSRGILVLRLAQAELQEPAISSPCPSLEAPVRLQYLDLSLACISLKCLKNLLSHCRQLKKLSLEHVELNNEICAEIAENTNLETLNLAMAMGLNADSVRVIMESLTNLSSLNISWTDLTPDAVTALVTYMTPNVIRLNAAGCRRAFFDIHVSTLEKRCPQLLELDLSDCTSLTSAAISSIAKFQMLEYLSVSRCYQIQSTAFIELKNMPSLTYLDIFGMLTDAAIEVLEKQMPKLSVNKFMHSSVARPTVGTRRTSIWGLRTRDT